MSVLDLAMKMGCFHTENDAVRIISAGGFYINQVREQNVDKILIPGQHILPNQTTLVRVGKRNYYIVDWS
jgi:tyrosyl-tRNA synthetase